MRLSGGPGPPEDGSGAGGGFESMISSFLDTTAETFLNFLVVTRKAMGETEAIEVRRVCRV